MTSPGRARSGRRRSISVAVGIVVLALVAWRLWSASNRGGGRPPPALKSSARVVQRRGISPSPRKDGAAADAGRQAGPPAAAEVDPTIGDVIRGHVKTTDGRPVEGVLVRAVIRRSVVAKVAAGVAEYWESVVRTGAAEPLMEVLTDADGAYAIAIDRDSNYAVFAHADEFEIRRAGEGATEADATAGAVVDFEAVDLADLRRVAVDAAAGDDARIGAWQTLCHTRGGFTPPVVDAVFDAMRTSKNAHVRSRAINTLHVAFKFDAGPPPEKFKPACLDALRADADEGVREWAAISLDLFLDDAAVRDALAKARDSDSSVKVRAAATKTLADHRR